LFANATVNVRALEASYRASIRITKAGKPHTIGEELILPAAKLDEFVKEHIIGWQHCVGVCTDGARAMMACIHEVAPNVKWVHCSIHQEAPAVKKIPVEMKVILDSAVKTVNFIKA
ncbi:ZBED5 protein, partial [Polyodon spathula]|nr:ZBED5 protein [Polyodon spathula]